LTVQSPIASGWLLSRCTETYRLANQTVIVTVLEDAAHALDGISKSMHTISFCQASPQQSQIVGCQVVDESVSTERISQYSARSNVVGESTSGSSATLPK